MDQQAARSSQIGGEALLSALSEAFNNGGWKEGDSIPEHMPQCFGCGSENEHGIQIDVRVGEEPDSVTCEHTFDDRHRGAPGVAHGGAVAAAIDDLFGFVLVRILTPAVTRELTVTYRLPVRLDVPVRIDACLERRDGRDLHITGSVTQADNVVVRARAVFVEVDLQHLASPAAKFGLV